MASHQLRILVIIIMHCFTLIYIIIIIYIIIMHSFALIYVIFFSLF